MEKKPEPSFFHSKNFDRSLLEEEPIKQTEGKEDKAMSETAKAQKGKKGKLRKRLSNEHGIRMIEEWDTMTVSEWAKEFDVSYQTISNMAKVIHKQDASLCPPKNAKPKKREDIAKEWIALLKKKREKK